METILSRSFCTCSAIGILYFHGKYTYTPKQYFHLPLHTKADKSKLQGSTVEAARRVLLGVCRERRKYRIRCRKTAYNTHIYFLYHIPKAKKVGKPYFTFMEKKKERKIKQLSRVNVVQVCEHCMHYICKQLPSISTFHVGLITAVQAVCSLLSSRLNQTVI